MTTYNPDFNQICGKNENFEEYGRFQQHLGLLEDTMRVGVYHAAIKASATDGRRVAVDVGGGSGVLTLCALKYGYEKVYYIEPSRKIAHYAAHIFEKNGVRDRVVILNKGLEDIDLSDIKEPIDLIVTETISTLFVGFGCWPKFNALREMMSPIGTVIPHAGKVHGLLAHKDMASRNDNNHGLKLLRDAGIEMDLYKRAFRSGGNVYEKGPLNYFLLSKKPQTFELVEIDAGARDFCRTLATEVTVADGGIKTGLLTWWELSLSEFNPSLILDSRDPMLTSWYPYYIPFSQATRFETGEVTRITVQTLACDAPYPFAFQIMRNGNPVSEVLYW
jgi:hypothetical protein